MSKSKSFWKRPPVKIAYLTLFFILMLAIGAVPVWVVFNMDQSLGIRILIGLSGPIWAVVTIAVVASRSEYGKQWKKWRHDREHGIMSQERSIYPEYQRLYELYPLSISSHERHWRHHHEEGTFANMVESALKVSDEEWAKREEFRRQNREERHSYSNSVHSDSLAPSRQESHHHHDNE